MPRKKRIDAAPVADSVAQALEIERRVIERVVSEMRTAVERVGSIELAAARYEILPLYSSPSAERPITRFRTAAGAVRTEVLCRRARDGDDWAEAPAVADGSPPDTYAWRPERSLTPGKIEIAESFNDAATLVAESGGVLRRAAEREVQTTMDCAHALRAWSGEDEAFEEIVAVDASLSGDELFDAVRTARQSADAMRARVVAAAQDAAREVREHLGAMGTHEIAGRTYSIEPRDVRVQVTRKRRLRKPRIDMEVRTVDVLLLDSRPVEQPADPAGTVLSTWDVDVIDAATLLTDARRIIDEHATQVDERTAAAQRAIRAAADAGIALD